MKRHASLWRCSLARVLVLAAAVVLTPLPLAAADHSPSPGLKASAAKIASAERLVVRQSPVQAKKDQAGAPATQSGSFFKTPTGIALLAVLAAGTGYALYSTSHDRIKSQAR